LPELATSAVAAYKKKTDIAIGNIIGSNIFNIFWVLGLSSIIRPIEFSPALNFDILSVIIITILLLVALFVGKRRILQKWEGYIFIILYSSIFQCNLVNYIFRFTKSRFGFYKHHNTFDIYNYPNI